MFWKNVLKLLKEYYFHKSQGIKKFFTKNEIKYLNNSNESPYNLVTRIRDAEKRNKHNKVFSNFETLINQFDHELTMKISDLKFQKIY